MALLASDIIARARGILLDPDAVAFSDATLLALLNQAERKVLLVRPELFTTRAAFVPAAGISQALPAAATALLDVYGNTVSKRRATLVARSLLESLNTFWPAANQAVDVQHWTHDPRVKTRFDVYPPNTGTGSLDVLMGVVPTPIASTGAAINLSDLYETPILYFLLAEAYSANTVRGDTTKAVNYESRANALLGVNAQSGVALAPKHGAPGGS